MRGFDNEQEERGNSTADTLERLDTLIAIADKILKALGVDSADNEPEDDKGGTEE